MHTAVLCGVGGDGWGRGIPNRELGGSGVGLSGDVIVG